MTIDLPLESENMSRLSLFIVTFVMKLKLSKRAAKNFCPIRTRSNVTRFFFCKFSIFVGQDETLNFEFLKYFQTLI